MCIRDRSYAVEVIQNGCTDTSECMSVVTIGILGNTFAGNIRIYPNPAKNVIHIDFEKEYAGIQIRISDLTGRVIEENQYLRSSQISIPLELPKGLYLIELYSGSDKAVFKIVKK